MANTDTSYSDTSAAATSSCVESGFEAQRTTSAPPACSVRIRFAVSVVTWRQAEMRWPASGCSRSNRSRIAASAGICRWAHSIRRLPSSARPRSFTSYRCVAAMKSFLGLRGPQQPLVLALLPLHPTDMVFDIREPAVDRGAQLRLAPQPRREGDVADPEAEAAPQLGEHAELVPLT